MVVYMTSEFMISYTISQYKYLILVETKRS